jgi:hypothetical protein
MEGDETRTTVSSRTGFLSMFGGASLLFGFGGLGLLESGTGAAAASGAFFGAAVALYVLLAPGAAGLYYRHRATFGWPGVVGVAVLLVGLLSNGVNGLAALATGDPLVTGSVSLGLFVALVVGSLLVGAAVVRSGALPNATPGGLLVALGLPASYLLLTLSVQVVGLELPAVVLTLATVLPYATGWVLLGFDMITEGDTEMPGAAADLRG